MPLLNRVNIPNATTELLTLGDTVVLGDLIAISTTGAAVLANHTFSVGRYLVAGLARQAGSPASLSPIGIGQGLLYPAKFGSAPAAASNGSAVWLSTSPGQATLTPPSGAGSVLFYVGILQGADGITLTPNIIFSPRYVSRRP